MRLKKLGFFLAIITLAGYGGGSGAAAPSPSGSLPPISGGDTPYYATGGYGTVTEGGLSGTVIRVTNLNKSGNGSLRAAIETSGARLVVFEVGGVINLERSSLTISNPYITIAGQTAPAPGITIIRGGISVQTHNVVIQHLAVRPGDAEQAAGSGWEPDGISTNGTPTQPVYKVVFDHLSTTWGVDENLSVSGPRDDEFKGDPNLTAHDVTLYKCIIAEGLSNSSHSKGEHSKGTLIHDSVYNVSIIGCLYAHNKDRNPRFKGGSRGAVVNCVMYNYGSSNIQLQKFGNLVELSPAEVSIVGNICIKGSSSTNNYFARYTESYSPAPSAYFSNNIARDRSGIALTLNNNLTVSATPLQWPGGLAAKPANQSLYDVLRTVGMRAAERDPIDARIVLSVINGTGQIINNQNQVGGYPNYTMTSRSLTVPDGAAARRQWLDQLAAALDTNNTLNMTALYSLIAP